MQVLLSKGQLSEKNYVSLHNDVKVNELVEVLPIRNMLTFSFISYLHSTMIMANFRLIAKPIRLFQHFYQIWKQFQTHIGTLRSKTTGSTHTISNDPRKHPRIDPNYLSHRDDLPDLIKCIKLGREIFAQAAFDEFRSDEYLPGSHVQSDKEVENWVLDNCNTVYHPCCSAKMGSVLDSSLNVKGIGGLTVCDASVMPFITRNAINYH